MSESWNQKKARLQAQIERHALTESPKYCYPENMIFNNKNFDDFDGSQDIVQEFDAERPEPEEADESADSALAWRRGMIERALANVKKVAQKASGEAKYTKGSLYYDPKKKHFGRIVAVSPDAIVVAFFTGETTTIALGAKPESKVAKEKPKQAMPTASVSTKKPEAPKKEAAKKPVVKKALTLKKQKPVQDPVGDPNGYIKKFFKQMSNKELAVVTGLSEHTIRRKLGEWGLKRAK